MKALLVVAHPDDETVFLGGYLRKHSFYDWTIVSVTHSLNSKRGEEFQKACEYYNARPIMLGFPDELEKSLGEDRLKQDLAQINFKDYGLVISHNSEGEYGHLHHIEVGKAVRSLCSNVFQIGYNMNADLKIMLNEWELAQKKKVIQEIYPSQASHWSMNLFDLSQESLISPNYQELSFNSAFLGRKDFWNYEKDEYETSRHITIDSKIKSLQAKKVLELGCHEGVLTQKLKEHSQVLACDLCEEALSKVVKDSSVETYKLNLNEISSDASLLSRIKSDEFDVILMAEVLYYLNDFKDVLCILSESGATLVCQHAANFHKRVDKALLELGYQQVEDPRKNTFGIGVYKK